MKFCPCTLCSFGVRAVDPGPWGCFQKIDGDISETIEAIASKFGNFHIEILNMDFIKFGL